MSAIKITNEEARDIVLRRFKRAGRVTDLTDEGLMDGFEGDVAEFVRALFKAGLLDKVRGSTRGTIYETSATGRLLVDNPTQ